MTMPKHDNSAAGILEQAGRALFDDAEDWQAQLADVLKVRRDTVRKWLHGSIPFGPDHPVLDRLLGIVVQRRDELTLAEADMRTWLERNRPGAAAEGRTENPTENRGPRPLKN
jgi:hypothetical protein